MDNSINGTASLAVRPACAPVPGASAPESPRAPMIQTVTAGPGSATPACTYTPADEPGRALALAIAPIPGECSTRTERVIAALVEARKAIGRIAKDQTNSHHGNRYADLAACREAVLAACLPLGIWVRQQPEPAPEGYPATWRLRTTIIHAPSGQWISSTVPMLVGPGANPMQAFASAETYACRYAIRDEFGLVIANDDDDANGAAMHSISHGPGVIRPDRSRLTTHSKPQPQYQPRADRPTPAGSPSTSTSNIGNPSHGKALYKWAREQEERGRKGVVLWLRDYLAAQGYKGRMVDLTEDDIARYRDGLRDRYPDLFGDASTADDEGGAA